MEIRRLLYDKRNISMIVLLLLLSMAMFFYPSAGGEVPQQQTGKQVEDIIEESDRFSDRTQLYRSCQSGTERNDVCGKERTGTPADPADPCINGMERDRSSSAVRRCHDHLAARDRSGRREDTCFSFTDNVSWEAAAVSDHSFYVYDGGDPFSMAGSLSICADPVVCISAVGTCDSGLRGGYDPVLSGICDLAGDRSEFFLSPVEILQSMVSAVFQ